MSPSPERKAEKSGWGSQRRLGVEQVVVSPRTVKLLGLIAWMGVSLSGRGGAQIGCMPEVAGREVGTHVLRVSRTQTLTLQELQMPS